MPAESIRLLSSNFTIINHNLAYMRSLTIIFFSFSGRNFDVSKNYKRPHFSTPIYSRVASWHGRDETIRTLFFFNSLFQCYQSFPKIDDESDSDQSNLNVLCTTKQLFRSFFSFIKNKLLIEKIIDELLTVSRVLEAQTNLWLTA